jgi:peptide deformylase
MLLKLYQTGQPILHKTSKRVSKKQLTSQHVQDIIDFMISTLRDAPGVGLAAPQVGEALQIIIIEDKPAYLETVPKKLLKEQQRTAIKLKVLVNPVLEIIDPDSSLYFEGCLSVDGYVGAVSRNKSVRVKAWDRHGNDVSFIAHGWQARILQHETDHLLGTLYIDKMITASFCSLKNFTMRWRKSTEKEIKKEYSF